MIKLLLNMCGIFYGVLCVFSIVTGLIYVSGKRELNPLELSDTFMEKYKDPEKRRQFAVKMGWVTFVVGIVQGMTSYAIFKRNSPAGYWFALGFTIFSICSVAVKLKGEINAFPALKCIAYTAILILLLLGETRALFLY